MHAVPASLKGKYVIRFTVTSQRTNLHDIARDWELIQTFANQILGGEAQVTKARVPLKGENLKIKMLPCVCVCS